MESSHFNKPAYRSKHEDVKKNPKNQNKTNKTRHQNHTMWERKVRKYRFFFIFLMMCLSLFDYQAKASRYRKGLTYLKNRATTNQNQILHSQKLKRKVNEYKISGNHPTKKRKEQRRNMESTKNKV